MSFGGGALLLSLSLGLAAAPTGSEKRKFHMVPLFTIGKSQNKNQVQYAIHVDGQCGSGEPSLRVLAHAGGRAS